MNKFIFDVDGTLTPSRGEMDFVFQHWFTEFAENNEVYLVTGSDYPKTLEQVGIEVCMTVQKIYNCSGNEVWKDGINIERNEWLLPELPHQFLSQCLTESEFPLRTGQHFEHRTGMVNFSIVGRGADKSQRKEYVKWDTQNNERLKIANSFNVLFPELEAKAGGETGIDIAPKGYDKGQIIKDFDTDNLYFFGDRMDPDGNDYPLAQKIKERNKNGCWPVGGWQRTWEVLKYLIQMEIAK
jgi:phosphomannomutase